MATVSRRCAVVLAAVCTIAAAEERSNVYGDPFVQITSGVASCPVPDGPLLTEREARAEAHWRVERGTSCFRSGRCRLPNSYLYDAELVPRVARFIAGSGRYADTSVWITGQRRWIYLKGCVRSRLQSVELERAVRDVDDVEAVVNQLAIGSSTLPGRRVAPAPK